MIIMVLFFFISPDGSDFIIENHLTLGQGVRSVTVPIEILNDELFESLFETFSVTLSSDVNRLHIDNHEAFVTIIDDDCECKLTFFQII